MTDNRLQKWALTAETISAVAVVITIGFLAFQMMENTNALRAQTYQSLSDQMLDYRHWLVDPDREAAIQKFEAEGWDALTPLERRQMRVPFVSLWNIYEGAFFANERGVLGEDEWLRFHVSMCRSYRGNPHLWNPGGDTPMSGFLTPRFHGFVEESCNQTE